MTWTTTPGRHHFVYWIYAADGKCLYVGRTAHPERRQRQHRASNPRMMLRASYFRMAGPYHVDDAARIESRQQELLQPQFCAPWKYEHEVRQLRRENRELRKQLERLVALDEAAS